jgi:hypothetical protein
MTYEHNAITENQNVETMQTGVPCKQIGLQLYIFTQKASKVKVNIHKCYMSATFQRLA